MHDFLSWENGKFEKNEAKCREALVILVLVRWRQENQELSVILCYIVNWKPAWAT